MASFDSSRTYSTDASDLSCESLHSLVFPEEQEIISCSPQSNHLKRNHNGEDNAPSAAKMLALEEKEEEMVVTFPPGHISLGDFRGITAGQKYGQTAVTFHKYSLKRGPSGAPLIKGGKMLVEVSKYDYYLRLESAVELLKVLPDMIDRMKKEHAAYQQLKFRS